MDINKKMEEVTVPEWAADAVRYGVPANMAFSLAHYIVYGQSGGGFLDAVLTNDLASAVARGDGENTSALPNYVGFLVNCAPARCWGSRKIVEAWRGLNPVA